VDKPEEQVESTAEHRVNHIDESGDIAISDDVLEVIAGIAASEVDGVSAMSGGLVGGISEIFGKKNPAKGVKVTTEDRKVKVDAYVVVDYGVRIPEVAFAVQRNIKQAIENMTELEVTEINIHVQGVAFDRSQPDQGEEEV